MESLNDIGLRCGTDKTSRANNYLYRYEWYLSWLPRPLHLLEIGVHEGMSIKMWLEYLPDSLVDGIDIKINNVSDPRFKFHHGDATDSNLWSRLGEFDVVVDDGSHQSVDVKTAFDLGFPHLKPGGLWIIEDVRAGYRTEYNNGGPTTVDMFRPLIDEINDYGHGRWGDPRLDKSRILFMHLSKSMIVIHKRSLDA